MSTKIIIVSNATKAKILEPTQEVKLLTADLLSYFVAGYENTYSYKAGRWDGKSTMFDWVSSTFPVGFLGVLNAALTKLGYEVRNLAKALPRPLGTVPETLGGFSYSDRYDYQWEGVKQLEKRGSMIARLATGAGKTFHAALATARIARPTLILTKRQVLMYQFKERMEDFGFSPGIAGDNRFLLKNDLTVAMSQTLSKKLENPDCAEYEAVKQYLNQVEFIIGEEVHEISDNSYWNIIQNCPNAYYRLGLTATPFMRTKSEANMKLLGGFGGLGIDVTEKMLIDRGINAKPIIRFAQYPETAKLKFGSNYNKAVFEGITHCNERNAIIVQECVTAKEKGLPSLVLVARKEHGAVLEAQLRAAGVRAKFIWGESSSDIRTKGIELLKSKRLDCVIGSNIFDVGVDVPAVGLVVMAGGGKAEVAYRQRIGRGLREKKTGPNVCFILDFNDEHNSHLHNHTMERLKVIKSTPGFVENLVPRGQPFPWELF